MTIATALVDELAGSLHGSEIFTDAETVRTASADSSPRSKKAMAAGGALAAADLVVVATSTDDVAATVRWANRHQVPVVARGGGSGVVGSGLPIEGGVIIDLAKLNAIGPVDVANRLVTVGAGVLGSDLEEAVKPHGLATGHYPQSFFLASVGGWVTMRGSGTFSSLYGNIEDRLAELEVVLPDGEILRTKSIPRASQGPDLKQLFIGSEGVLGIVTHVTLRLVPLPESRRFNSVLFETFEGALATARETLVAGVHPAVLRIYDPVEGAAKHAQFSDTEGWLMILAFDGYAELTAAQEAITLRIAGEHDGQVLGAEPGVNWEQRRFNWSWFTDAVDRDGGIAEAIEIAATWSELPSLLEAVTAAARGVMDEVMSHVSHIYDQGASLYVISRGQFASDDEALAAYDRLWGAVMEVAIARDARISHHHGIGLERAAWMEEGAGENGLEVLRKVKRALDPAGIMNPGKLGL